MTCSAIGSYHHSIPPLHVFRFLKIPFHRSEEYSCPIPTCGQLYHHHFASDEGVVARQTPTPQPMVSEDRGCLSASPPARNTLNLMRTGTFCILIPLNRHAPSADTHQQCDATNPNGANRIIIGGRTCELSLTLGKTAFMHELGLSRGKYSPSCSTMQKFSQINSVRRMYLE
ncbi:uncharacterized protein LOC135160687 [Diachasmimorpha longicaudata]|uniref:uncharacterized protein LOC135160687 n=1 Tax=Diachasmimorpha longicaudata TaxID=58733 RepID=UPI0030B8A98E